MLITKEEGMSHSVDTWHISLKAYKVTGWKSIHWHAINMFNYSDSTVTMLKNQTPLSII